MLTHLKRLVVGRKRGTELKGYLSVQETAQKWDVSVRWVNQYILAGRTYSCERLSHAWAIPEDTMKPERLTLGVKPKQVPANSEFGGKV